MLPGESDRETIDDSGEDPWFADRGVDGNEQTVPGGL
jgi:hypothetical protein